MAAATPAKLRKVASFRILSNASREQDRYLGAGIRAEIRHTMDRRSKDVLTAAESLRFDVYAERKLR